MKPVEPQRGELGSRSSTLIHIDREKSVCPPASGERSSSMYSSPDASEFASVVSKRSASDATPSWSLLNDTWPCTKPSLSPAKSTTMLSDIGAFNLNHAPAPSRVSIRLDCTAGGTKSLAGCPLTNSDGSPGHVPPVSASDDGHAVVGTKPSDKEAVPQVSETPLVSTSRATDRVGEKNAVLATTSNVDGLSSKVTETDALVMSRTGRVRVLGHDVDVPSHVSAGSHSSTAPRHSVPLALGGYTHRAPVSSHSPSALSSVHVPRGLHSNLSGG